VDDSPDDAKLKGGDLPYGEKPTGDYEWRKGYSSSGDDEYAEEGDDPAEALVASLRQRFLQLRASLRREPPPDLVSALPKSHSPFVGPLGPKSKTFRHWSGKLRASDPLPVQVAAMDHRGILRLLRIIMGGKFLRVGVELRERTSRWLWALLARLPDSGELSYSEVSIVRDLGLRAVLLTRSVAEMAALRDEVENGGVSLGLHDGFDDSEDDEDVAKDMSPCENVAEGESPPGNNTPNPEESSPRYEAGEGKQQVPEPDARPTETGQDGAGVVDEHLEDGEVSEDPHSENEASEKLPTATADAKEDGELDDDEAPMDIDSVSSSTNEPALEAAKAKLLARLENGPTAADGHGDEDHDSETDTTNRARLNMRATLNMIITVAGEFYGQRDLLEFRSPFMGM
jgi:hypothetical protein